MFDRYTLSGVFKEADEVVSVAKLKNHLLDFGMDWQDASDLIMTLIKLKWVKKEVNGDIVAIRDKK